MPITPSPNLIFDSYHYIRAATLNLSANAWPIGYSKFLQLCGYLCHNVTFVLTLQYILLQLSSLLLFYTWLYIFQVGKLFSNILFLLLFLNPIFPFCSNFILSDPLFIALSIAWITQLLWIVFKPQYWMILTSAIFLATAFTVRYNALYYPLVTGLAFMLCRKSWQFKALGIAIPLLLAGLFIVFTISALYRQTGARQFSPFGGWKLANDALYAYIHVPPSHRQPVPDKFRLLDSMVINFNDTSSKKDSLLYQDLSSGSFFMLNLNSPLLAYLRQKTKSNWQFLGTPDWMNIAPLYQSYGGWIIKTYPSEFLRYFLLPNILHYAIPPNEIFGSSLPFSWTEFYGGYYVRQLFHISSIHFPTGSIRASTTFFLYYPIIFFLLHISFLFSFAVFTLINYWQSLHSMQKSCLILLLTLWSIDFCFSLVSAWIVLRYQIFISVIELFCTLLFISRIYLRLEIQQSSL